MRCPSNTEGKQAGRHLRLQFREELPAGDVNARLLSREVMLTDWVRPQGVGVDRGEVPRVRHCCGDRQ